ncbi:hypothetical protein SERLADRAFT_477687 [Serpula lacrymans var. lacrymans S7.9]|uniref:Uncharacterized protein n=1 Tax=Serpula lacrymans var. lacrymans (strain S7.9) TaxID=578457 RepID=F8P9E7_SERL9|nr:uncharacterized protein SERLADRAFT_477687 [Serpula lacrymans var. lacrymans S7.9]EGO20276.1 hypothetical protein SERLADRAFT_477687 [Serpula lacrymans var. lacrymans S7.9]
MFLLCLLHIELLGTKVTRADVRNNLEKLSTEVDTVYKELQHALTVSRGYLGITCDEPVDIAAILGLCAGLVTVDAGSNARLIHYTAREYFSNYKKWLCSDPHSELTNGTTSADLVNITAVVKLCAGLVVVDAGPIVRLIHYTAQEYFSKYEKWLCSDPH